MAKATWSNSCWRVLRGPTEEKTGVAENSSGTRNYGIEVIMLMLGFQKGWKTLEIRFENCCKLVG
jgi:hypothetical protein